MKNPEIHAGEKEVIINDTTSGGDGVSIIEITERGGTGAGVVTFFLPGTDDGQEALRTALWELTNEYKANADEFKDKYSFFCPWAEGEGLAVREQPFYRIENTSGTTYIIYYNGPVTVKAEARGAGIEIFKDNSNIALPASGDFYMEVYEDKKAERDQCGVVYGDCLLAAAGDPAASSECNRVLQECMDANVDGWNSTLDFETATRLVLNRTDSANVTHSFDDISLEDSIRIFDAETGHFLIARITTIWGTDNDNYIRFGIENLSHSGAAIEGNPCSIEFYRFAAEEINLDDYVKKSGDTMEGGLKILGESTDSSPSLMIQPFVTTGDNAYILQVKNSNNSGYHLYVP